MNFRIGPSPTGALAAVVMQLKSSAGLPACRERSICVAEWSPFGLALHPLEADTREVKATAFDRSERLLAIMRCSGRFPEGSIDIVDIRNGRVVVSRQYELSPNGSSIGRSPDGAAAKSSQSTESCEPPAIECLVAQ